MDGDKYLVLGHPRCGTGYSAELLKSYGLNIGHERMGTDGISCWQYVIKDDLPPFSKKDLNNKNIVESLYWSCRGKGNGPGQHQTLLKKLGW